MIKEMINGSKTQNEILEYYNTNITYKKLPRGIDGFVFNYRGINNIFINNNLSYFRKQRAILHELSHIELNHLEQNDKDLFAFKVSNYEDEADEYLKGLEKQLWELKHLFLL